LDIATVASMTSALLLVSGCSTTYDPNDYYASNAIEKLGRVVSKTVAHTEQRRWADPSPPIVVPIGGVFIPIATQAPRGPSLVNIYAYVVKVSPTESVVVHSEFPGREVGDCVKVFLSERASYPRMAAGSDCPD